MTTTYNKLRRILTDRLPRLRELSPGCEVEVFGIANDNPGFQYDVITDNRVNCDCIQNCGCIQTGYYGNISRGDFKIIGHLPTLQDVLLALDIKNKGLETGYRTLGGGLDFQADMGLTYDLTLPLSQQSDETLLEIIKLIE